MQYTLIYYVYTIVRKQVNNGLHNWSWSQKGYSNKETSNAFLNHIIQSGMEVTK